MSSVTTAAIVAEIEKQVAGGIARLKAQHEQEMLADIARVQQDLDAQLSRVRGLTARIAKPAVEAVKVVPQPTITKAVGKNGHRKAKKSGKGVVKFRDPDHPERTWTGRGTRPAWFKAGIATGKDESYFAVRA